MPNPIPVALVARLGVDLNYQKRGIGRSLMRDAAQRTAYAAETIGIRGVVAEAISEDAWAFYLALGFEPSAADPMTLMITLNDILAGLT